MNATLLDSVVLKTIVAPAGNAAVRVIRRDAPGSTDTEAVPPVTFNTPMLAIPIPVTVTVVPMGSGSAGPAVSVKPGPRHTHRTAITVDVVGADFDVGVLVTVTDMLTVLVLSPWRAAWDGPSCTAASSLMVQWASEAAQVVKATVISLPPGMLACTLSAGAAPLLVIVTGNVPPCAERHDVA